MEQVTKNKIEREIDELIKLGARLHARLQLECFDTEYHDPPLKKDDDESDEDYDNYLKYNQSTIERKKKLEEGSKGTKSFNLEYEKFYTLALKFVKSIEPGRLDDFVKQYKDEKRKEVSVATYLISDAIVGYEHSYGNYSRISAAPRMATQVGILLAIQENLSKSLNDIDTLIRADLFDDELESASHLLARGHIRAAGAVAGVVLESHLAVVSDRHGFKSRKKNLNIADYNEFLKSEGHFEIAEWRRVQSLADIRNLCDHQKGREPSTDDVSDMIKGVARVIKEFC